MASLNPDSNRAIYIDVQQLSYGTHTIAATVGNIPDGYGCCIGCFEVATNNSTSPSSSPDTAGPTSSSTRNVGTGSSRAEIAGGVGGIILLALIIIAYHFLKKRHDKRSQDNKQSQPRSCLFIDFLAGNTDYLL